MFMPNERSIASRSTEAAKLFEGDLEIAVSTIQGWLFGEESTIDFECE
jgi:hypothetical protein